MEPLRRTVAAAGLLVTETVRSMALGKKKKKRGGGGREVSELKRREWKREEKESDPKRDPKSENGKKKTLNHKSVEEEQQEEEVEQTQTLKKASLFPIPKRAFRNASRRDSHGRGHQVHLSHRVPRARALPAARGELALLFLQE